MRFPFALSRSLAGYLLRQKLAGRKRFPLVLMLEPLARLQFVVCRLRPGAGVWRHDRPAYAG